MKYLLPLLLCLSTPAWAADDYAKLKAHGTIIFQDEFDRKESDPAKEDVGPGWKTNSQSRAKGNKQVTLEDGVVKIVKSDQADHGVSVMHDAAFQDGAVEVKFRLQPKEQLGIHFFDRELKTVHSGHLCNADVSLTNLDLEDAKTGAMDLENHDKRLKDGVSPEMKKLIDSKHKSFPLKLSAGEWHRLLVVIEGDTMRATVDDRPVGEFKSEGFAHPTKRAVAFAVGKAAQVDYLKVWKLK